MKVKSLSHVRLLVTPRTAAYQALPSMGFSRQEYWSGVPLHEVVLKENYKIDLSQAFFFEPGEVIMEGMEGVAKSK